MVAPHCWFRWLLNCELLSAVKHSTLVLHVVLGTFPYCQHFILHVRYIDAQAFSRMLARCKMMQLYGVSLRACTYYIRLTDNKQAAGRSDARLDSLFNGFMNIGKCVVLCALGSIAGRCARGSYQKVAVPICGETQATNPLLMALKTLSAPVSVGAGLDRFWYHSND